MRKTFNKTTELLLRPILDVVCVAPPPLRVPPVPGTIDTELLRGYNKKSKEYVLPLTPPTALNIEDALGKVSVAAALLLQTKIPCIICAAVSVRVEKLPG